MGERGAEGHLLQHALLVHTKLASARSLHHALLLLHALQAMARMHVRIGPCVDMRLPA